MADLSTAITPLFGVPTGKPAQVGQTAGAQIGQPVEVAAPEQERSINKRGPVDNVLGFLGDLLTSRLGMGTPYRDARRNEKIAEAFQGFDSADPNVANEAFRRGSVVDFAAATKLRDQWIDNQRNAASLEATMEAKQARLAAAQTVQNDRTRNRAAAMLNSMTGWSEDKRKKDYPLMREEALRYASKQGLDLSSEIPETFDAASLDAFVEGSIPTGTQRAQRFQRDNAALINEDRDASLLERKQHNRKTEAQGDARIGIAAGRAAVAERRAANSGGGGGGRGRSPSNVMTYVGEDGYKYAERSDGTVVKSKGKVRAGGSGGKPAEGTRRVITSGAYKGRTAVIRNGKPVLE